MSIKGNKRILQYPSSSLSLLLNVSFSLFSSSLTQVELAHGGRGPSSSDRRGGHGGGSGGGRFGLSRHSEYRGAYLDE